MTGAGGLSQSLTVTYSDNTNAGTATASASFGGDANHKSSSDSKTFTIEKADAVGVDHVGGSADVRRRARIRRAVGEWGRFAGRGSRARLTSPTTAARIRPARRWRVRRRDAGTYTVLASFAGNGNYNPASATKTITIEKASSTTMVSCPASVTYNGSAQDAVLGECDRRGRAGRVGDGHLLG